MYPVLSMVFIALLFSISIMSAVLLTGFAKSLGTSQPIEIASNNNGIVKSHALITTIGWTKDPITDAITASTVTVKNSDSVSHQFEICVLAKEGSSQSTSAGDPADCANTPSIASAGSGSATINFSSSLGDTDSTLVTIQEIS